ncbi:hypothetical protein CW362_25145 [Streptomyces populi]|uniref:Uncharacterized protein n=1 Tax=Streptomyces populi TaxID=2058924 RepID=A0A2I0SK15_9ACTN|nr:hypothetical protein CW362_25145 [Streptomyces populi]
MNVRLQIHLLTTIAIGLGLFFSGQALGGMPLGLLGLVIFFFVLEPLIRALLPASFLPAPQGAQATCALYRGWAAELTARLGLGASRTVEADAARLRRGTRLSMLSYGLRDGSQTLGHVLLRQSSNGEISLAWRKRGKSGTDQPISLQGPVAAMRERRQQNAAQARTGFTVAVDLGTGSYWLRHHDAALLQLLLGDGTSVTSAVSI